MNLSEGIKIAINQTSEAVVASPKMSLAIPAATAAIAPLTEIAEIQGYLSITSMIIGIVVSLILLKHRWIALKTASVELKEAEHRLSEIEDANK